MPASLTIQAAAKLNLALSVGPPEQETGMHPIASWMLTVSLFDDLHLLRLEEDRLSRYAVTWHAEAKRRSEIDWSISKDLAVRAHQALERHTGRRLPVQMRLEKRIPVGGGLGGGSSNAAAMLRAVNELFELGLSQEELAGIGGTLGSDVPFLVHGGSAVVEGLGERIQRHEDVPALHAVIAFPDAGCPTGPVYRAFDDLSGSQAKLRADEIQRLAKSASGRIDSESLFNDLAAAAMQLEPRLRAALDGLSRVAERKAHVTGSGSSIFVVCDDAVHAMALADAVERQLRLPAVAVESVGAADEGDDDDG